MRVEKALLIHMRPVFFHFFFLGRLCKQSRATPDVHWPADPGKAEVFERFDMYQRSDE